ncbi:hypothetical protein [Anaerotignum sp.]|nr:hypothetical protein [Anaerotignum sp.]
MESLIIILVGTYFLTKLDKYLTEKRELTKAQRESLEKENKQ